MSMEMARRRPLSIKTGKENLVQEKEGGEGKGTANGETTEEPVSPGGRLFRQPRFNCNILAVMGLGKRIDVGVVKAGLEATLLRHPRFSSIQVLDERKPRWVRTKVAVEDHITVPELDPDVTSANPDKAVEDYVASLSATTLDLSRPLWELHILNVATSEAAAVAVLRMHHSLGDGVSLVSLLLACTRQCSNPDALPSVPDARRSTSATTNPPGVFSFFLWVWAGLVLAWHTLVDMVLFVATAAFLKDTRTPLMGMEGVEFHPKRFVHRNLSLDDIKDIKKAMNCTVNDVLVGIMSAGLSRYLERRYGESDDTKKKKGLPANIRLRTALLVNVRPTPGIHALAEMMDKGKGGAKWGNLLGYILLRFPIAIYQDPLEYVRRGKAVAGRKKNSLEAVSTYWSAWVIAKILGIKVAAALCYRVLTNTTVSFSNIVGPVEKIEFYGHPVVYIAPSVYGHPHAVTVHFQSYVNTVKTVLAVDELTVPDPHQLLDDLAESLRLMKDAIATRS